MTGTIYVIIIIGFAAVLLTTLRSGHFIKNILNSALTGILSILSVNVIGLLTGVTVAINWYTLIFTAIFGIPGTITFVLLNCCFLS